MPRLENSGVSMDMLNFNDPDEIELKFLEAAAGLLQSDKDHLKAVGRAMKELAPVFRKMLSDTPGTNNAQDIAYGLVAVTAHFTAILAACACGPEHAEMVHADLKKWFADTVSGVTAQSSDSRNFRRATAEEIRADRLRRSGNLPTIFGKKLN